MNFLVLFMKFVALKEWSTVYDAICNMNRSYIVQLAWGREFSVDFCLNAFNTQCYLESI